MTAPSPSLNLLVLRSTDASKTAGFYALLGLNFQKHRHGEGPEHYAAQAGPIVFEIYPLGEKGRPTHGVRIGFAIGDVDEATTLLERAGARILQAPADSEWGRRAVVKDPDGHTLELLECRPQNAVG